MRVVTGTQLRLELQPGLLTRFGTLRECVYHSVLSDPRGFKAVAADCDLSKSELSRRLNPQDGDPRSLDVDLFVQILKSTKDLAPLHWLMATFLEDDETKRGAALDQLRRMLPEISALVKAAQPK